MIVITLARKPLTGTVALNALKWGCGGLNIDQTRIGTGDNLNGGAYAVKGSDRPCGYEDWRFKRGDKGNVGTFTQPEGRFPANLILTHLAGCVCIGTKKPGGDGTASAGRNSNPIVTDFGGARGTRVSHYGADGKETVQAWNCLPECPVKGLDEQSGLLTSGTGAVKRTSSVAQAGNKGPAYGAESRPEGTEMISYGDTGGASRFFKQVQHHQHPESTPE